MTRIPFSERFLHKAFQDIAVWRAEGTAMCGLQSQADM